MILLDPTEPCKYGPNAANCPTATIPPRIASPLRKLRLETDSFVSPGFAGVLGVTGVVTLGLGVGGADETPACGAPCEAVGVPIVGLPTGVPTVGRAVPTGVPTVGLAPTGVPTVGAVFSPIGVPTRGRD